MKPANVERLTSTAPPVGLRASSTSAATRTDDAPALRDALGEVVTAFAHYADTYATLRREPIGCDLSRGPILLDVLRSLAALAANEDQREQILELVSDHALDLEE